MYAIKNIMVFLGKKDQNLVKHEERIFHKNMSKESLTKYEKRIPHKKTKCSNLLNLIHSASELQRLKSKQCKKHIYIVIL